MCQFEGPSLNSKHICGGDGINRENHFSNLFLLTNCSVLREEVLCDIGPLPHRCVGCIFRDPHFLVLLSFPNRLLGCRVRFQPVDLHLLPRPSCTHWECQKIHNPRSQVFFNMTFLKDALRVCYHQKLLDLWCLLWRGLAPGHLSEASLAPIMLVQSMLRCMLSDPGFSYTWK